jgi:hypothetical protein
MLPKWVRQLPSGCRRDKMNFVIRKMMWNIKGRDLATESLKKQFHKQHGPTAIFIPSDHVIPIEEKMKVSYDFNQSWFSKSWFAFIILGNPDISVDVRPNCLSVSIGEKKNKKASFMDIVAFNPLKPGVNQKQALSAMRGTASN